MAENPSNPWGRPSSEASREWAHQGHASTELQSVYSAKPATAAAPVGVARWSKRSRRTAGTVALIGAVVVSSGSALAFRDALFPDTGDATARSIWENPGVTVADATNPIASGPDAEFDPTSTTAVTTPTTSLPETSTSSSPVDSTRPSSGTAPVDTTASSGTTSQGTLRVNSQGAGGGSATATPSGSQPVTSTPGSTTAGTSSPSNTTGASQPSNSTPSNSTPSNSTPSNSTPSTSTPSTSTPSTSTPSTSTPSTSTPSTSTPSSTVAQGPAPFSQTYNSTGGSISVSWTGTRLTLNGVNAAAGFESDVEANTATRIRVEFDNGDDDYRIEVRFSNGQVISNAS